MNQNNIKIIETTQAIITDCFVKYNKIGKGSGEAKLYIGAVKKNDWNAFFNAFKSKCIFFKKDIIDYLTIAKVEYESQEQGYKRDSAVIKQSWYEYIEKAEKLNETIYFDLEEFTDKAGRYYVRSKDDIFHFFRCFSLPTISSVQIRKIMHNDEMFFVFVPFLNNCGDSINAQLATQIEKEIETDPSTNKTTKEQLILARHGQGNFREKIVEKYVGRCVVTQIDDERVLTASHIKPWALCNDTERLSKENGLLLSPNYDSLFDLGFITFSDNGDLITSIYFSDDNFKKMGLEKNKKYNLKQSDEMKKYLSFHRENIFKK